MFVFLYVFVSLVIYSFSSFLYYIFLYLFISLFICSCMYLFIAFFTHVLLFI